MKKLLISETFLSIFFCLIIGIVLSATVLYMTAPKQWYAGQHDAKCEKALHDTTCHCYERLAK